MELKTKTVISYKKNSAVVFQEKREIRAKNG